MARFSFGDPTVHGDFEGIAAVGDRIFLVTSDGVLYAGRPGADGEHVEFVTYATGLGQICEIEGLAYDPSDPSLLLLCKEARSRAAAAPSRHLPLVARPPGALSQTGGADPRVPVVSLGGREVIASLRPPP